MSINAMRRKSAWSAFDWFSYSSSCCHCCSVCSPQIVASCWLTVGSSTSPTTPPPCPTTPCTPFVFIPFGSCKLFMFFSAAFTLYALRVILVYFICNLLLLRRAIEEERGCSRGYRGRGGGRGGAGQQVPPQRTCLCSQCKRRGRQMASKVLWVPAPCGHTSWAGGARGGLCTRRMLNAISNTTTTSTGA